MTSTAPGNAGADRQAALILAEARRLTGPAHRASVCSLPGEIRHIIGYHTGWWDAGGSPVSLAGKAIRPAFALACAKAVAGATGDTSGELAGQTLAAAVDAAVAVELVHDFSLVHDDVIDGDAIRRHRPTVWKVFGTGRAILAGDVLLTMAIRQLECGEAARVLVDAVRDLCAGQFADLALARGGAVTVAECLAMSEDKTGALLGAACQLGALAVGADDATATQYRAFGRDIGLAFQLADDLLGIWGDPAMTGKPAGSDLASRKRSLPVVAALTSGTPAGAELARLYESANVMDDKAIARAADLVEAAGGRDWAQSEAARRTDTALRALQWTRPHVAGASDLRALTDLITRRDR